jgi:hypothetical protein
MEKRLEKIILWWLHHLCLDVAVQKEKSPCHNGDEVADAVVAALIFKRATMEKTIPPCPLIIVGEEDTLTLRTRSTRNI